MYDSELGLLLSFIAMIFVMISYFVKNKKMYLVFQALCIVFLALSYLVIGQFFTMVGLIIALIRALVFFCYERLDKPAPIWIAFVISLAIFIAYAILNLIVQKNASSLDIIVLIAGVMYAFIFRIRDLKIVRFTMLAPTFLSFLYNILIEAPIFLILSYGFEGLANIVSIFRYHVFPKRAVEIEKQETGVTNPAAKDQ